MKRKVLFWLIILTLTVSGCGIGNPQDNFDSITDDLGIEEKAAAPEAAEDTSLLVSNVVAQSDQSETDVVERVIIRTAQLCLVVQDTESSLEAISALVKERAGYVVTSQMTKYDTGTRISLTVRVPAEALDETLVHLREMAQEVQRQEVTGQDVTQEYTDLQARLRHLQATETRLLAFLEEAEDTEAALAVYSELQRVQGEIESVKGRIQYLEGSSTMSTINIELIPDTLSKPLSVGGWRPQGTLRDAFEALLNMLRFLVDALIWILIFVLPLALLVLGLPATLLVWLVRRRQRGDGDSENKAPDQV